MDSLYALRASRTIDEDVPVEGPGVEPADSLADVLREMSARLESRAEEAAELRVRLELTERAQSTLEDERRQTLQELEEERRRREEAERKRDDLHRELYAIRQEPRESPEVAEEQQGRGQTHAATGGAQEGARRPRPWWLTRTGSIIGICLVLVFGVLVAFLVTTWIL